MRALALAAILCLAACAGRPDPRDRPATGPLESRLHAVVEMDKAAATREALDDGANPAARGTYGQDAVYVAAHHGSLEALSILLEHGKAPVDGRTDGGLTALHGAAINLHGDCLSYLVDRGAEIDAKDKDGNTPLHWAALGGGSQEAAILLDRKADPGARNKAGETPLHLAAISGDVDTCATLLKAGADPALKDEAGKRAVDHAGKDLRRLLDPRGRDLVPVPQPE